MDGKIIDLVKKEENPIDGFVPGNNQSLETQVQGLANMLGVDISKDIQQNPNTEEMKKDLMTKLISGINNGQTPEQILDTLLVNMPDNDDKKKMKESLIPMLAESIKEVKENNPLSPEKVQKKIQEMLARILNGEKIEEVVEELVSTLPEEVDKEKVRTDLINMLTEASEIAKKTQTQTQNLKTELTNTDDDIKTTSSKMSKLVNELVGNGFNREEAIKIAIDLIKA